MQPIAGICPLCQSEGRTGKACQESVCVRHGYHFIPVEHFNNMKDRSIRSRDQNIGLIVGDYLMVDELGEGGFGKVYLALQMPIFMKVALKLMVRAERNKPLATLNLLDKFEGEALSLAQLNHPNIVRLLKYGTDEGKPYLVMEYVENAHTLKEEFERQVLRNEPFTHQVIKQILDQLLNALNSAHSKSIIHRDIKPENIMLQPLDGSPHFVRILDFGLAKFVVKRIHTSIVIGTPRYMAPEQFTKKDIGPWTDLYAVGIIAFEMFSGKRPFTSTTMEEIIAQKVSPTYDPTAQLVEIGLPGELTNFLRKAINRNHEERYQSALQLKDALAELFEQIARGRTFSSKVGMADLLDETDRARLSARQKQLEKEAMSLEEERRRLDQERRRFEAEIKQFKQLSGEYKRSELLSQLGELDDLEVAGLTASQNDQFDPLRSDSTTPIRRLPVTRDATTEEISLDSLDSIDGLDGLGLDETQAIGLPEPDLDSKDYDDLAALAKTYVRNGNWFGCLKVYARMIRVTPSTHHRVDVYYRRAKILQERLGNKREAENHFRYALQLNPAYRPAFTALRQLLNEKEEWNELLELLTAREQYTEDRRQKAELLSEIGTVYQDKLQNLNRATSYFEQALELNPVDPDLITRLIDLHFREENWKRAAELLETRIAMGDPSGDPRVSGENHWRLARALEILGDKKRAQLFYESALELIPNQLEALKGLARLNIASKYWDRAIANYKLVFMHHKNDLSKDDRAQIYCHLGMISSRVGDDTEALAYLKKAHKNDVRHVETLELLIEIHENRGDWRQVLYYMTQLAASLRSDSERFRLMVSLGDVHRDKMRDMASAIESYRSALQYKTDSILVLVKLLEVFLEGGKYKAALKTLKQLIKYEKDPEKLWQYYDTIGTIYRDQFQDETKAIEFFNRALDSNPDHLKAFESIDRILTRAKDWKKLALIYRKMIRRIHNDPEKTDLQYVLYKNLGEIYRSRLRDLSRAVVSFQHASEIRSDDLGLHEMLARMLDELCQADESHLEAATQAHRQLLRLKPDRLSSYQRINKYFLKLKQFDKFWSGSAVVCTLGKADASEQMFFERYRMDGLPVFRKPLALKDWKKQLFHPDLNQNISKIFRLLCPIMHAAFAPPADKSVAKKKNRVDLEDGSLFSVMFNKILAALSLKPPEVYVVDDGDSIEVNFSRVPSVFVGRRLFDRLDQRTLAMLIANRVTYLLPTFYLATARSDVFLTHCMYAAIRMVVPEFTNPMMGQETDAAQKQLEALPTEQQTRLEKLVKRLLEHSKQKIDLNHWLFCAELSANHTSLLIGNDFEAAIRWLRARSGIDSKSRKAMEMQLARYAVSEEYFAARRILGINIS